MADRARSTDYSAPALDKALDILTRELTLTMRQAGTPRLADIGAAFVIDRGRY